MQTRCAHVMSTAFVLVTAWVLAIGESACGSQQCDDGTSLLQTYTKLKVREPKYSLFGLDLDHDAPRALKVHISCDEGGAPFKSGMYDASEPVANDGDRVVYTLKDSEHRYLLTFPRGPHATEAWEDEVALSEALPAVTQRAWKCVGEVVQADTLIGGGEDYTYAVLVKTYVVGFPLTDVLMTLAAPKDPWLKHKVETPGSCDLGDFNEPTYNAVLRAFEPHKEFPLPSLQSTLTPKIRCFFSLLMETCSHTGLAWTEIRPENVIYGTASNEDSPKLMLRNAMQIKRWNGAEKDECKTKLFESHSRLQWPSPSCSGPYWPAFFISRETSEWKSSCHHSYFRVDGQSHHKAAKTKDNGSAKKAPDLGPDLSEELDDVSDPSQ